jgi:hypothetical protein
MQHGCLFRHEIDGLMALDADAMVPPERLTLRPCRCAGRSSILVANFAGDWVMTLLNPGARRALTRFRAFRGLRTSLPAAEPVAPAEASTDTSRRTTAREEQA